MEHFNQLKIYTVYEKPSDYPEHYVVRIHSFDGPNRGVFAKAQTYEPIAKLLKELGLYRIERHPQDDPVIKETWL